MSGCEAEVERGTLLSVLGEVAEEFDEQAVSIDASIIVKARINPEFPQYFILIIIEILHFLLI